MNQKVRVTAITKAKLSCNHLNKSATGGKNYPRPWHGYQLQLSPDQNYNQKTPKISIIEFYNIELKQICCVSLKKRSHY
ncbi:Uncharacterized protein TCM_011178 [Theobroma cacao]|uniref:Uncharacterized protein n=1 Tax=Theobroma cacao TaxID=3641 RepID=A0A061EG37_THECC|nr:Uncharacterized protein TCM_011178 [Theobroma cacao]